MSTHSPRKSSPVDVAATPPLSRVQTPESVSKEEYQTKTTATEKKNTMAGLARAQAHKKRRKKATVDVTSKRPKTIR